MSWVARGLSRSEQGKINLASGDFAFAGRLFAIQGDTTKADQLNEASKLVYDIQKKSNDPSSNGVNQGLIVGVLSTVQALAPFTVKALLPMIP